MNARDWYRRMSEPIRLDVVLSAATAARLRVLARELDIPVEDAVGEAVRDWTLAREQSLGRARRARLEEQMRRVLTPDGLGSATLGTGFRFGVDRGRGGDVWSPQMEPVLVPTLKERRLRLGLSQQALAELAQCSIQVLRAYENGITPHKSDVLPRIELALTAQEAEAP